MRGDVVTVLDGRDPDGRVVFDSLPDSVESIFVIEFVEKAKETPDTGTGAVIILLHMLIWILKSCIRTLEAWPP
jgi:hypothetical protein